MAFTPTTTFHAPGHGNVFIPTFGTNDGATGRIQVEFSRNPARFAINQYMQVAPDSGEAGFFLELDTDDTVRVVNLQDYTWPDGNDAPDIGAQDLRWKKYLTERRAHPFVLGRKAVTNSARGGWDIVAAHSRFAATQAMTARSVDATTVITTAANFPAANQAATGTLLGGGAWTGALATSADSFILKGIQAMVEQILLSTGGAVTSSDLVLVVGPDTAHGMRATAEIIAYLTAHESSM